MFGPKVPEVSATAVSAGAVLVDVREPEEWVAGHIDGAVHLPLGELAARVDELPDGELVMLCRSGQRSARAVAWLNRVGRDAVNLSGGMHAWEAAGRPMVSETGAPPAVR